MLARGAAEIEHDSVAQVVQAIVDQGCRHKEEEGEEGPGTGVGVVTNCDESLRSSIKLDGDA